MATEAFAYNPNPTEVLNPEVARLAGELSLKLSILTIPEIDQMTSDLATQVYAENPLREPVEFYRRYAQLMPLRVSSVLQDQAIQAIIGNDPKASAVAKRAFLFLRMPTVINVLNKYATGDLVKDSELLQAGISNYFERASDNKREPMSRFVQDLVGEGISRQIAAEEGIPVTWIYQNHWEDIRDFAERRINTKSLDQVSDIADGLIGMFPENSNPGREVWKYVRDLIADRDIQRDGEPETSDDDIHEQIELSIAIQKIMRKVLDSRTIQILEMRFGLNGYESMTLDEIAKEFNVTRERIRQVEGIALWKLGKFSQTKRLITFIDNDRIYGDSRDSARSINHTSNLMNRGK